MGFRFNGKIPNTGGITNLKIAYLDCFSGISGDMCLGALVDAGVSLKKLLRELEKIPLKGYEVRVRKVKRAGITATKADVLLRGKLGGWGRSLFFALCFFLSE